MMRPDCHIIFFHQGTCRHCDLTAARHHPSYYTDSGRKYNRALGRHLPEFSSKYFILQRQYKCQCDHIRGIMSSSGHGQSTIKSEADIDAAWKNAQEGGRAGAGKVIVEGFVPFDYEITLLTVRYTGGTTFLKPIGHHQVNGDYQESWQPQPMSEAAIAEAQRIAGLVTGALGGRGIFGVELFICGDKVLFSEVSPRPHDTGMVTMISQDLSEFDLHARAILGLPIPNIAFHGPSASKAIVAEGVSDQVAFEGVDKALEEPDTQVRLFGKPELKGHRRLGVCLARAENVDAAVKKVFRMREKISIKL